jgi:hypothetical protein
VKIKFPFVTINWKSDGWGGGRATFEDVQLEEPVKIGQWPIGITFKKSAKCGIFGDTINVNENGNAYLGDNYIIRKLSAISRGKPPKLTKRQYYAENGAQFYCKELFMRHLKGQNKDQKFLITEEITEEKIEWLNEVQRNVAPENRFTITLQDNYPIINLPKWWLGSYYRLGFALLALRMATRNTKHVSLKNYFDAFVNGKFSVSNYSNQYWSEFNNWVYNGSYYKLSFV